METKRKITKYPRFGYYHVKIFCDIDRLNKILRASAHDESLCSALVSFRKDIEDNIDLFERILLELENENLSVYQNVRAKKIDVDRTTFRHQSKGSPFSYVYFQIANNREDAIYKKRLGEEREKIDLDNDEYIGEYCNAIYCPEKRCLLFQQNKFSVSVNQFALFFKQCISDYYQKELSEKLDNFPVEVRLDADLDPNLLGKISHGKIEFQKIKINGDAEKLRKADWPVLSIGEELRQFNGYEFTIEIKAKKEGRSFSGGLSNEAVKQLYEAHKACDKEDELKIITQMKEDDIRDVLDWSTPKRERIIPIEYYLDDPPSIDSLFEKIRKIFECDLPLIRRNKDMR